MGCTNSNTAKQPSQKGKSNLSASAKSGVHELKQVYSITNDTKVLGSGAFGKVFLSYSK